MLTVTDLRGVSVLLVTPCIPGGQYWVQEHSVDLDETSKAVENLVQAGVGSITLNSTAGESAALLPEERAGFVDTVLQVNHGRVPILVGATALGTRETMREMQLFKEMGADGVLVGLSLWQTPTLENSIQWYAQLSEAVPEMPVVVDANPMFFKTAFSVPFWTGLAERAPRVIGAFPADGVTDLKERVAAAGSKIVFIPGDRVAAQAYDLIGSGLQGLWSMWANMGPEPVLALMDSIQQGDEARMREIAGELDALPSPIPAGKEQELEHYGVQAVKAQTNAAGYIYAGPTRAPYMDIPEEWQQAAEANGRAYAELRQKYIKTTA